MGKKKSKKKKRKIKIDFKELFFHVILLMILLFCFAVGIQQWKTLAKWDTGGIVEHTGGYTFSEHRHVGRRTSVTVIYEFKLDNGKVVSVSGNQCSKDVVNAMKNEPVLTFRYSLYKSAHPLTFAEHIGVSIMSADKSTVFVDEEDSKDDLRLDAIICTVLAVLVISFHLFFLYVKYWSQLEDKIKRYKRRKEKKKRKLEKAKRNTQ